jgi:hypothetical protein
MKREHGPVGNVAGAVLAAFMVWAPSASFAQDKSPAPAPAPTPVIEQKALDILKAAGAAIGGAKTLSFTATSTYERAARNGQPLYYSVMNEVSLQRPDKLRVIKPGDGPADEFYYDGKTMTAYIPSANLAATADAPPTIDKMLDAAWDKAAIYFPFVDAISDDPFAAASKGLKSLYYVGQSITVGGVKTDMIAGENAEIQAEIWIGADDHLPRLLRARYVNEPAQAHYETAFTDWKLNPQFPAGTFASEKAKAAQHIEFEPPGADQTPAPK